MNNNLRLQLSSMMFLEYFIWGAWYITMGNYLGSTLNFTAPQIGISYTAVSIAAMISPIFVGMVADRYLPTQRILGILHLIGGLLLLFTSYILEFGLFYPVFIGYMLCYMPTIALTNSLSFHHMENPGVQFPGVRVVGTIGFIAAMNVVSFMGLEAHSAQFQIAAACSVALGIYSFFLPHTPPKQKGEQVTINDVLGLDALKLMKKRSFAVLVISSILISVPLAFYYSFANPFLNDIGMERALAKMSLGQVFEIIFLIIMPFFFVRLGVKKMIMVAMAAWALRYVLFAYGNNEELVWMLYGGIVLHGICYDFFFVTGQIYVDEAAPVQLKSAAQGLITFATYGVGMFIGSWLSGEIVGIFTDTGPAGEPQHHWQQIWLVPAIASAVVLVIFTLTFRDERKPKKEPLIEDKGVPVH
ncbi:nucleoside permease [soil metagenome]